MRGPILRRGNPAHRPPAGEVEGEDDAAGRRLSRIAASRGKAGEGDAPEEITLGVDPKTEHSSIYAGRLRERPNGAVAVQLYHPVPLQVAAEETVTRCIVHDVLGDYSCARQNEGSITEARAGGVRALRGCGSGDGGAERAPECEQYGTAKAVRHQNSAPGRVICPLRCGTPAGFG